MAGTRCPCGSPLSNVLSPSKTNGVLMTDSQLDDIEDPLFAEDIITIGADVWECSECGRIGIGNKKDKTLKWYTPDDGTYGEVCR